MTGPIETAVSKGAWDWIKNNAKQVFEFGKRIATLEERVTALEEALKTQPANACPFCGERAMRKTEDGRLLGSPGQQWKTDVWTCKTCGQTERKIIRY